MDNGATPLIVWLTTLALICGYLVGSTHGSGAGIVPCF
jgi:hypothetical protein